MLGEFLVNRFFVFFEVWDVIFVGDCWGRFRCRIKKKVNDWLECGEECELNCVKEGIIICIVSECLFVDGGDDCLLGSLLFFGWIIK